MKLVGIAEHKSLIQHRVLSDDDPELSWNFSFRFLVIPEDGVIEVYATATCMIPEKGNQVIIDFEASHFFEVNEIERFIYREGNTEFSDEERLYVASIVGISISGVRGMIYTRSQAIHGRSIFFPIVNPTQISKDFVPFTVINWEEE